MPHSLIWLPKVLMDAGLKVALVDGWEDRGRGDVRTIRGVICHHTATNKKEANMPTLQTLIEGRPDLRGPLAQLGLGRDGTYYVIAAGRCNHAGEGIWRGMTNGNANFIGIEAENTGRANDIPWPAGQLEAYRQGVAAILKHIGRDAGSCAGHNEYARPKGRKPDPSFDMVAYRASVAEILNNTVPKPVLIPVKEEGAAGRPTLRRGASGPLVQELQQKLKINAGSADGIFGPKTEAGLRAFQRAHNLLADGIVGPKTWSKLDELAGA
jgi:N-acetyl-anhydromuramyl-L-alanine amidase AmpD